MSKMFGLGIGAAAVMALAWCTSRAAAPGTPAPAPPPVVNPPQVAPTRSALAITPAAAPADGFASAVRPVLVAHCAPCHEPGGKMYERLPFDRAETIASHRDGVLRRLKGDDREAVAKWLESQPAVGQPVTVARDAAR